MAEEMEVLKTACLGASIEPCPRRAPLEAAPIALIDTMSFLPVSQSIKIHRLRMVR